MKIIPTDIRNAVAARLEEARRLLFDLIAIPSLPGQESAAMNQAADAFARLAEVQRVVLKNTLRDDRDYCDVIGDIDYESRSNLRVVAGGTGDGRNLLLNTHMDTVPPSHGQQSPYQPRLVDGSVFGRGACDAKGQVATVWLTLAALKDLGVSLRGNLIAHIVVEEEVGGNGTLAMVRHGEKADGCVVLEPTELRILTSIRGAIWFRITLHGRAGHSGKAGKTRSALKMATRVIEILENYHNQLLSKSRGDAMFDKYPDPMPLTVGQLHAGNWAATAPGYAQLEGVLGLLPNKTARQVMDEVTDAIRNEGGPDIAENFDIHFTYRHDASVCPTDNAIVESLSESINAAERATAVDAMTASCDAWFYNNQLNIPTVVFGGGSLGVAHSNNEHMPLSDLAVAAETLAGLAIRWCA